MGRAILVTGDLARNISDQYNIDRRRTASLLDIFSCVMQGPIVIIPIGIKGIRTVAVSSFGNHL